LEVALPQPLGFLVLRFARSNRLVFAINVDRGLWVQAEVQTPGGMAVAAEIERRDRVSVSVT
jgi:hypothetical protein